MFINIKASFFLFLCCFTLFFQKDCCANNNFENLDLKGFGKCVVKIKRFIDERNLIDLSEYIIHKNIKDLILTVFAVNRNYTNRDPSLDYKFFEICSIYIFIIGKNEKPLGKKWEKNYWGLADLMVRSEQFSSIIFLHEKTILNIKDLASRNSVLKIFYVHYNITVNRVQYIIQVSSKWIFFCPICKPGHKTQILQFKSKMILISNVNQNIFKSDWNIPSILVFSYDLFNDDCKSKTISNLKLNLHCYKKILLIVSTLEALNITFKYSGDNKEIFGQFFKIIYTGFDIDVILMINFYYNTHFEGGKLIYCNIVDRGETIQWTAWTSSYKIWVWLLFFLTTGALILYIKLILPLYKKTQEGDIGIVAMILIGLLFKQPVDLKKKAILILISFSSFVFLSMYETIFTSEVISPKKPIAPFSNLVEIVDAGYKIFIHEDRLYSKLEYLKQDFKDLNISSLFNKSVVATNLDHLEKNLTTGWFKSNAMIFPEEFSNFIIKFIDYEILNETHPCFKMRRVFNKDVTAIFLHLPVTIIDEVRKKFEQLKGGGFEQIWNAWFDFINNNSFENARRKNYSTNQKVFIDFITLLPLFLVFSGLLFIAIIVYVTFEIKNKKELLRIASSLMQRFFTRMIYRISMVLKFIVNFCLLIKYIKKILMSE